jgi:hypothetical protein
MKLNGVRMLLRTLSLKILTTSTSAENALLQCVIKANVDLAGPLLLDVLQKLFFAKDGPLPKNLLIVLAVDATVDGLAKLLLTTNQKVFAGIRNILTLHVKEAAKVQNAHTLVLTLFTHAKTPVVESQLLWLVTLLQLP